MRDLLVTLLFCYGGIKALRYPFIAALLWTWIGLMNPHRLGWGFAYNLPFAMISVGLLVISMMAHPKLVRWPSSGPVKVLVCFLAWMGITTLAAFHVPESATSYVNVLKVLGVTLLVGCVIRTREEILAFIAVTVLSVAFFGIEGTKAIAQSGAFDLGFQALPVIFQKIPLGHLFGALWFFLLFIAYLNATSAILPISSTVYRHMSYAVCPSSDSPRGSPK